MDSVPPLATGRRAAVDRDSLGVDRLGSVVNAIAQGDAQALERLYDMTSGVVLELAQRILGKGLEAEEVVLDVYQRVWARAGDFDSTRGSVRGWLLTMTRSRAVDVIRALQTRRAREMALRGSRESDAHLLEGARGPIPELLRVERRDHLASALDSLTPEQREVIERAFFDGLSHEHVARALGQPLGTVKGQIRRGLRRLRLALERHEVEQ